jgi:hypothetical protein
MLPRQRKRPAPPQNRPSRTETTATHSNGYADAALHLLECGLLPAPNLDGLRRMWKAGGYSGQAAEIIAQAWDLVAA